MVALAILTLVNESPASPPTSKISGLPNLFGVCVYSFMCHHSLPGLVTPISNKKRLYSLILGDYALILSFYFLLAFTGIFAFRDINDLYTLNFQVRIFWSLNLLLIVFLSPLPQTPGFSSPFISSSHCSLSLPSAQTSPSLQSPWVITSRHCS